MHFFRAPAETGRKYFLALLLLAVTLVVFWKVGDNRFVSYDDPEYVYENPFVRGGLGWGGVVWAFTSFHSANWHPLTWLSHMADVSLFGLDPRGHHFTSLFIHGTNAILLFLLLCRLTGFAWRSFVVAAFFAIHPLHVESVAWIAERKDILSGFFWFLALYAYARYAESPGRYRYLTMLIVFALGLMAKPMLVTLPFVLLLLDYWPLGRLRPAGATVADRPAVSGTTPGKAIIEKVPLLVLSAISCAVTLTAQHGAGAVKSLETYAFPLRFANALATYADYLYRMVWPWNLAVFYPFPRTIAPLRIFAAGALLALISAAALRWRRERPYLLWGWLWYLGTLVPVIGLVQVGGQGSADRYTYLPLVGILVAAVWLLCDCTARFPRRNLLVAVAAVATLGACAFISRRQVSFWKNDFTLYSRALAVTDGNYVAHNNLGFALVEAGRQDEAVRHFDEAIRIAPFFADAYLNRGDVVLRSGDPRGAMPYIEKALELRPDFAAAYNDLGVALLRSGRPDEAYPNFDRAAALDPLLADAAYNKGIVLAMRGRTSDALSWYRRALELDPGNPGYHLKIGEELLRNGMTAEAAGHFSQVLRLNPGNAQALRYLERLSSPAAVPGSDDGRGSGK